MRAHSRRFRLLSCSVGLILATHLVPAIAAESDDAGDPAMVSPAADDSGAAETGEQEAETRPLEAEVDRPEAEIPPTTSLPALKPYYSGVSSSASAVEGADDASGKKSSPGRRIGGN